MRRTALLFLVVIAGLLILVDRGSSSRDDGDHGVVLPNMSAK